jgi:cell wall assembly regulator SMI1
VDEGDETTVRVRTAFERVVRLLPGDPLLNPPATGERLAAAEEHLGQRLPDDVRALYRLADGQVQYEHPDLLQAAGLVGGEPFLPLARVLLHWDQWAGFESDISLDEFASSTPEGFVRPRYSVRGWIPLTHDGGGNHVGVDLDPDERGRVGQVITFGRDDEAHRVLAPSIGSYLEQLADLLDQGLAVPGDDDEPWSLRVPPGTSPHALFRAER